MTELHETRGDREARILLLSERCDRVLMHPDDLGCKQNREALTPFWGKFHLITLQHTDFVREPQLVELASELISLADQEDLPWAQQPFIRSQFGSCYSHRWRVVTAHRVESNSHTRIRPRPGMTWLVRYRSSIPKGQPLRINPSREGSVYPGSSRSSCRPCANASANHSEYNPRAEWGWLSNWPFWWPGVNDCAFSWVLPCVLIHVANPAVPSDWHNCGLHI